MTFDIAEGIHCHALMMISGEDLDPQKISSLLELKPSSSNRKGEPMARPRPDRLTPLARKGLVSYSTSGRRSGPSCTWRCVSDWDGKSARQRRFSLLDHPSVAAARRFRPFADHDGTAEFEPQPTFNTAKARSLPLRQPGQAQPLGDAGDELGRHSLDYIAHHDSDGRWINELAAMLFQARQRAVLIFTHESGITDDIGCKNGREFAFYRTDGHAGLLPGRV